ncbi:hypothetical protein ACEQPO_12915 [Bacillus sp. SL00103]
MTLPLPIHQENIIKGRRKKCIYRKEVHVLQKVTRDQMMEEYGRQYPEYQFEKHKGYGTKEHLSRHSNTWSPQSIDYHLHR